MLWLRVSRLFFVSRIVGNKLMIGLVEVVGGKGDVLLGDEIII